MKNVNRTVRAAKDKLREITDRGSKTAVFMWFLFTALASTGIVITTYHRLISGHNSSVRPATIILPSAVVLPDYPRPASQQLKWIARFQHYIDSLKANGEIKLLDSLSAARPGLFDSLELLKQK